jgi:hypothetical protein
MATYLGAAAPPNAFDSLRTIVDTYLAELPESGAVAPTNSFDSLRIVDTYLAELPESSVRLPSELIRAGATLSVDELLLAISSHARHVYFRHYDSDDSEYQDDGEARTERVFGTKPERFIDILRWVLDHVRRPDFESVMATRREYALKPESGERYSNLDDLLRCCEEAGRCLSLKHWSDLSEHESLASFKDRDFDRYDVVFVAQISSVLGLVIIRKEDEDWGTDYALGLQQDFQISGVDEL